MTGYTGTVHFTSSDPVAVLPANTTLTNGAGTFSATLNTGGSQTITATDAYNSSITGTANTTVSAAGAENGIQVYVNGSPLQMNVAPKVISGRTMLPMRAIFEALGAVVRWDATDQSIVATKGSTAINLQIGSTTATNNGVQGGSTASFTVDATTGPWHTGVTINGPRNLDLEFRARSALTATVAPDNAYNAAVTWSSSNTGVVTVDPNSGLVTAIAPGSTTITATTVGAKASGLTCADTINVDVTSLPYQGGQGGQGKIRNRAPDQF